MRHIGEELNRHDPKRAERFLTESLLICRELNDLGQEAWTTYDLGTAAELQGDLAGAERSLAQSLALFARLGHPLGLAVAQRQLAYLAEARGDPVAADGYLARVVVFADQLGPTSNGSPWLEQGQIAFRRGDYQRATELLQAGYDQARQRGDLALETLRWLARCHQACGELDAATACCQQVLAAALAHPFHRDDLIILATLTAHTASLGGQHGMAARLLGCIAVERATERYAVDFWRDPEWDRVHEHTLAACRDALSEAAFVAAWAEGRELRLEQAVQGALAAVG